jgi:hypothetical protein
LPDIFPDVWENETDIIITTYEIVFIVVLNIIYFKRKIEIVLNEKGEA